MERAQISVDWLAQARKERHWTQSHVAEQLDVDPRTEQRWESGECVPSLRLYRQLCILFDREDTPERVQTFSVTPHDDDEEANVYTLFRASDLTARLLRIVLAWPQSGSARYQLQDLIAKELERKDNAMYEQPINRRNALRRIAALPIDLYGLSLAVPVLSKNYPFTVVLTQCASGITACWYLRKSKDLAFADHAISRYIPALKEIAEHGPALARKEAADLLAQALLLKASLVRHVEANYVASLRYSKLAEKYSKLAENTPLTVVALRDQAAIYDYADNWPQAAQTAEKAKHLMESADMPLPLRVQSYIYIGLANYQAHCGQKQEALTALGQAQATYYAANDNQLSAIWMNHDEGNICLSGGLAYYHLDMSKEAIASLAKVEALATSETSRAESFTDQAWAELSREDRPRDMEFCVDRWQQGLHRALALKSEQAYKESKSAYMGMRAAWPAEQRIKTLRDEMVHW